METIQPYFLLSLSVIGALILVGIAVLRSWMKDIKHDVAGVSDKVGDHGEQLVKLSVTLTGPNGDNGINGEVKHLRRRMDDWDRRIGELDRRHA